VSATEQDEAAFWAAYEREDAARSQALKEVDGQVVDLNAIERRVREILAQEEQR
jgi:hypothetical protein